MDPFLDPFLVQFWIAFEMILGAIWAPRLARERSGGAYESQVELREAKKTTFKKVVFAEDCLHLLALETPQDGPKRPRRLPKSVPRELRNLKKQPPTRA